jgi:hypothetical protein
MRKTVLVIAGMIWSSFANAEFDVHQLFKALDVDKKNKFAWELSVVSTESGLAWANVRLKLNKERPLYCSPAGVDFTPSRLIDMLRQGLKDGSDLGGLRLGDALLQVLQEAFPCK